MVHKGITTHANGLSALAFPVQECKFYFFFLSFFLLLLQGGLFITLRNFDDRKPGFFLSLLLSSPVNYISLNSFMQDTREIDHGSVKGSPLYFSLIELIT